MIKIINHSSNSRFQGWVRTTAQTDSLDEGTVLRDQRGSLVVIGKRAGADTRHVFANVDIAPSSSDEIHFGLLGKMDYSFKSSPPPKRLISYRGVSLDVKSQVLDGACWVTHYQKRFETLMVDVWEYWFEGDHVSEIEVLFNASDSSQDFVSTSVESFMISAGANNGVNYHCGFPTASVLGDGQCRAFSGVIIWDASSHDQKQIFKAIALIGQSIQAVGVETIYPFGNPAPKLFGPGDMRAILSSLASAKGESSFGVRMDSGSTGAQNDQFFQGGRTIGSPLVGAFDYHVVLNQARQPCHHREPDGSWVEQVNHPHLVFWDSRPHLVSGVSPDRLGKTRNIAVTDTNGWRGPDEEHLLLNRFYAVVRTRMSYMVQALYASHANNWLLQKTIDPRLSTTRPGASRAAGYECWNAYLFFYGLADRRLADRILNRARERLDRVLLPATTAPIYDVRTDDVRLGSGSWVMYWQHALWAYGAFRLGQLLFHQGALTRAREVAEAVIQNAFYKQPRGRWKAMYSREVAPKNERANINDYMSFACCLALAVRPGEYREIVADVVRGTNLDWVDPTLLDEV